MFSRGLGSSRDLYHVIHDGEMICVMRVISNVKVYGRPLLNPLGNLCLTIGILWSSVGLNHANHLSFDGSVEFQL